MNTYRLYRLRCRVAHRRWQDITTVLSPEALRSAKWISSPWCKRCNWDVYREEADWDARPGGRPS
jgi:hypothetical protein